MFLKLLIFKILFYPRYRYYVWLKNYQTTKDWETHDEALMLYCDLIEPISTYKCANFHLKYESWKSVAERMML